MVTAGQTIEYIDPVIYITTEASGKQGYEIALALDRLGIKTTLIIGPSNLTTQKNIKTKKIVTANELLIETKKSLPVDVAICTAAVSDFKPVVQNKNKLKKNQKNIK